MVCCFYGMGILVTIVQFRSTSIMLPGKRGFADATWSSKLAVLGLIGTKVTFNIPPYLGGNITGHLFVWYTDCYNFRTADVQLVAQTTHNSETNDQQLTAFCFTLNLV